MLVVVQRQGSAWRQLPVMVAVQLLPGGSMVTRQRTQGAHVMRAVEVCTVQCSSGRGGNQGLHLSCQAMRQTTGPFLRHPQRKVHDDFAAECYAIACSLTAQ